MKRGEVKYTETGKDKVVRLKVKEFEYKIEQLDRMEQKMDKLLSILEDKELSNNH